MGKSKSTNFPSGMPPAPLGASVDLQIYHKLATPLSCDTNTTSSTDSKLDLYQLKLIYGIMNAKRNELQLTFRALAAVICL